MSLIYNLRLVRKWYREVVSDLEGDEVYIVILCARKKYSSVISRSEEILDKCYLKRDMESNIRRLRKFLRVAEGDYVDFNTGNPIPVDAMVVYMDLYPKSTVRAVSKWVKGVFEWIDEALFSEDFDMSIFRKVDTKLFSAIARSSSRKPVRILDVDSKDEDKIEKVLNVFPTPDWVTETRGGYHLIYKVDSSMVKELGRTWREFKDTLDYVEVQWHQGQTVIPGTLQGGFCVDGWKGDKFR